MASAPLRELTLGSGAPGARVHVWAAGSGLGHLARSLELARRIGVATTIWHQVEGPLPEAASSVVLERIDPAWDAASAREALLARTHAEDVLVVDTFPGGLAGEIDDAVLARFTRRVLVARRVRPGSYADHERLASRFDARLLPYPEDACEWEGALEGVHVGHLVREVPLEPGAPAPLAVLGDVRRLPPGWLPLLPPGTRFPASRVAPWPRAERYLSVGAGYNTVYELARLGVPFRLFPLERRYDDPFRRADRLGVGVHRRSELEAFLAARTPEVAPC